MVAQTGGGLVKLSIQLYPEQIERLERLEAVRHWTRAEAIRQLVDAGFKRLEQIDRLTEAIA